MTEEREEELDIVKSLEETAANSYEDGYREGWKKGIDELIKWVKGWDEAGPKYVHVGDIYKKAEQLKKQK